MKTSQVKQLFLSKFSKINMVCIFSILILCSLNFTLIIEAKQTDFSSEDRVALLLLSNTNTESIKTIKQMIKSGGGTPMHVFPPNAIIAEINPSLEDALRKNSLINLITYSIVDPITVMELGDSALFAVESWNNNFMGQAASKGLEAPLDFVDPGPIINDVKNTQKKAIREGLASQAPPFGIGFYDTSEYMIGDISVGIILTESNGAFDFNYETWTDNEINSVISEIQNGLNWWAKREPKAHLTFTYDAWLITAQYEPILRPSTQEGLWIGQVMGGLGYSESSYYDRVYSYLNDLRDSDESDWAVAIFVADSSQDPDGCFSDGYFGYAYPGGPFIVMTYDNDGYGISNMDAVTAHEFGHIFYAADEYYDPGYNDPGYASDQYGYLGVENQNLNGEGRSGTSNVPCLMRGQVAPFTSGSLCSYTRGHVGLKDQDNDGFLDIVDFLPNVVLNELLPDPTLNPTPTFTGYTSSQECYSNNNLEGNQNDITINTITSVSYSVYNSSDFLIRSGQAVPIDGYFDSSYESYSFTVLPELGPGYYKVKVNALCSNSLSNISNEDYITIIGSLTITSPNGGENWISGTIHDITWISTGNSGEFIKIELVKNEVVYLVISSSTENDGLFSWTISSTQILASDYKIRITSTTNADITDSSNVKFCINEGLMVTSPNGGESWVGGSTHEIAWTSTGSPTALVKIELVKPGVALNKVIIASTPNDGSYSWVIPMTQALGQDFKVKITRTTFSTGSTAATDTSEEYFSITR